MSYSCDRGLGRRPLAWLLGLGMAVAASGCAEGGEAVGGPGDASTTTVIDGSTVVMTPDGAVVVVPAADSGFPVFVPDAAVSSGGGGGVGMDAAVSQSDGGMGSNILDVFGDLLKPTDAGVQIQPDAQSQPAPSGGGDWTLNPGSHEGCPPEPPGIPVIGDLCLGIYTSCQWTNQAGNQYTCICDWIHGLCI